MLKRWFVYLSALLGCVVFYIAYQEWVSWIMLGAIACLPPFSLLLSLPAMLTSRIRVEMPAAVTVGAPTDVAIRLHCPLPTPVWRVRIVAHQTYTGNNWLLAPGGQCPTEHCGALNCKLSKGWVYDYLGLFRAPLRCPPPFRVLIRPTPLSPGVEPDLSSLLVTSWRPKPGGGFAENHELRLYRPGDNLHQIHWKLTAKTGKLILREPMVPDKNRMLLWLTLHGEPDVLDRKLRKLLWLSGYLLRHGLTFDILAYAADGKHLWHISSPRALRMAINSLLCYAPTADSTVPMLTEAVNWAYYIGGEDDEEN